MAQTLIKIDYTGEKCTGIYYVGNDVETVKIGTANVKNKTTKKYEEMDVFGMTKDIAPKGTVHKFVIRQTVTVQGVGKITAKETFTKQWDNFYTFLYFCKLGIV